MSCINDIIINEIIDLMPETFDSHKFYEKLMRKYPQEYAKELSRYQDHTDPFLLLHPILAKRLSRNNRLRQAGKVNSLNIGGNCTRNEFWEKIDL